MENKTPTDAGAANSVGHGSHPVEVYENIVVQLKKESGLRKADFGHCFFSSLGFDATTEAAWVQICQLSDRKPQNEDKSFVELDIDFSEKVAGQEKPKRVRIGHSSRCPARLLQESENLHLKHKLSNSLVRVGVCSVIENGGKVLITRRSRKLRTFPLKWVFPGGHVNFGETLEQAAAREALEETGLHVCNLRPLACWESCYPTYLESGVPTAQHLVVYYLASLDPQFHPTPSMVDLSLQTEECDAAAWISRDLAEKCMAQNAETKFEARELLEDGTVTIATFSTSQLIGLQKADNLFESLALGTAFVLKEWMASQQ